MLIIRLVMVHMGPQHTQYGQKTARLAPVLQNGLNVHVRPPTRRGKLAPCALPSAAEARFPIQGAGLAARNQAGGARHMAHRAQGTPQGPPPDGAWGALGKRAPQGPGRRRCTNRPFMNYRRRVHERMRIHSGLSSHLLRHDVNHVQYKAVVWCQ